MSEPVLITGPDRSGTTLMFALLASHSQVSMSRRTNMWRWFYGRFGDLGLRENLERCLDVMFRYHRLAVLEPNRERIVNDFLAGQTTYGRLFSLFHEHHAELMGKSRWGDKSLHTEHFADEILEDIPGAKIIHMLRDPRDRHASVSSRYAGKTKGVGAITGRWVLSTQRGERNAEIHPDSYRIVRYEDLASSPEETLLEVCEFIRADYEPAMLAMRGAPEHGDEGNSSFERIDSGVISTRSIGRWKQVLSTRQVASIELLTRRKMLAHGYELASPPMNALDRIRFLSTQFPFDFALMAGWLLTDGRREKSGGAIPPERLTRAPIDEGDGLPRSAAN